MSSWSAGRPSSSPGPDGVPVTGTDASVIPEDFRALMSRFPTGIAVVTAMDSLGRPRGMTCSSLCSVSLHPPTLLVCIREGSPTLTAMLACSTFAVNFLHSGAQRIAELFASGRPDRFDLVDWELDGHDAGPHLPGTAHTIADCRVLRSERICDHSVVFGEVYRLSPWNGETPLLYGLHRYRGWSDR